MFGAIFLLNKRSLKEKTDPERSVYRVLTENPPITDFLW